MDNGIKRMFDGVRADAALRESTYTAVCREISARREAVEDAVNRETSARRETGEDAVSRKTSARRETSKNAVSHESCERAKPCVRAVVRLAAGCAAAFAVMLGGYSLYFAETSFVSIDVNPSIELGLNRLDRVVSVSAYNDGGSEVISGQQLMNKPYSSAVALVLERVKSAGYVNGGGACVAFTVQSSGGERREQSILSGLHGYAEGLGSEAQVVYSAVDEKTRVEAHSHGMTAGKYLASLELQSLDPGVTLNDCRDYSMGEIKRRTDECHAMNGGNGAHGSNGDGNANGSGNVAGNGSGNAGHGHGGRHGE